MTSILAAPSPSLDTGGQLHVERADITFANVTPERVGIAITVRNHGDECTEPALATLMAAPLGAFVPWRPLALVPVPALEPGESFVMRTEAIRAAPAPLGPPDRVPPKRLLTALGSEEDQPAQAPASGIWARRNLARVLTRQGQSGPMDKPLTLGTGQLPADLLELLGRTNQHWAGNLNLFIGSKPVERHLAQALRVYPGRVNIAMFIVGSGPDAYAFHLDGEGANWEAALYNGASLRSLALDRDRTPAIALDKWVEVSGHGLMLLALCPPEGCSQQTLEVHVKQRSTGQTAVVEFSLDPKAAGPGCYVV